MFLRGIVPVPLPILVLWQQASLEQFWRNMSDSCIRRSLVSQGIICTPEKAGLHGANGCLNE